ncbi:MAG: hypothetical protein LBQ15_06110 [Clostridium sp.]|nr:hypothetical protein [Clostridium sp.]
MDIKIIFWDVDGTLTDSHVYYGNDDIEMKAFSIMTMDVKKSLTTVGFCGIVSAGYDIGRMAMPLP